MHSHLISRIASLFVVSLFLSSCFSGSDLPTYNYGPSAPGGQHAYSPKALDSWKGSHALGFNFDTYQQGYYATDQLTDLGQLDYSFSYKLKYTYINLHGSLGGKRYYFGDPLIGRETTYQGFVTAGFEFGGYTNFNNSKFEWRYLQLHGGVIIGGGSYHDKMRVLDYLHNEQEYDGQDSLYFSYSGSSQYYVGLSTELQYSISNDWRVGGQLGGRAEILQTSSAYLTFFGEYKNMGMYAIFALDDTGSRTDPMGMTYQVPSRNRFPIVGAYFRF